LLLIMSLLLLLLQFRLGLYPNPALTSSVYWWWKQSDKCWLL
jgi:hypothetical protein